MLNQQEVRVWLKSRLSSYVRTSLYSPAIILPRWHGDTSWISTTVVNVEPLLHTLLQRATSRKFVTEKHWREFFSDPSLWWDHRSDKANPRYPDFKHKHSSKALWLLDKVNPPWVEAELAAIIPESLQANNFSWNIRLAKHVKAGDYRKAMEIFGQMQREDIKPDRCSFLPVLNACARLGDLEEGRRIHLQIIQTGHESDVRVASSLVDMYAKCGSLEDACRVFNNMPTRDVVAWTAMILAYVKCGEGRKGLELARQMHGEGVEPGRVTFLGLLNACASLVALEEGRYFHQQIIEKGYESDVFVGSSLIDMYTKCGSMEDSRRVFNKLLPTLDVVPWNAMVLGYVKCGEGRKALELFKQMQYEGVAADRLTFVGILNACASIAALEEGRQVHEQIIANGYGSDGFVGSSLVDMYAKCGRIGDAQRVFQKMPARDIVAWSAMIQGYVKCGQGHKALEVYHNMHEAGVDPNCVTFVGALNACASVAVLEEGRLLHEEVIRRGYESDVFVGSSLVDMYAKCGSLEDAQRVFGRMSMPNVISWNAMLAGYARHGNVREALGHFERMDEIGEVNDVTFIHLLTACNHGGLLGEGLHFFESMTTVYGVTPTLEHYALVVDLLGRANHLQEAEELIRSIPCEPDVTVWISLLGACRLHGDVEIGERVSRKVFELDPGNDAGYVTLSNLYAAAGKWDSTARIQRKRLETDVRRLQVTARLR